MKIDNLGRDFITNCKDIDFSKESVNKEKNLELLKSRLAENNKNPYSAINHGKSIGLLFY